MQVLTAANGREGIILFQQHQANIGLVLLDMQMPVMSGEETFSVLRELQADVKVILSSGYSEIEALRRFNGRSINSFLQKPYDLDTLVTKVQAVLSS
jgi:YesN/AraC family two-component response regulator